MINKIIFDCERLKYPNTGLYTFCESLGNALINNITPDQQITAYLPASAINIFGEAVKYQIQKPWHKLYVPGTARCNVWHSSYQLSRYYPSGNNVKIVLTIHDLNFLIEKKDRPSKIHKLLQNVQHHINKAAVVVCISHFIADQVKQHLDLGGKQIHVIYNGCTVNDYPDFHTPGYTPSKPFLFTIGTVLPKKNFHVLPALLKDNDYELVIAGNLSSPQYVEKILNEARRFNVTERVKIVGTISAQERSWYYKQCQAFVFPSLAEGFGLPVIEAMHYGKPVFLSTHTSLPEIGGNAAYYFEDFDAVTMQQALKKGLEDFLVSNMGARAKARAAQFSWDDTAKSYLEIYNTLAHQPLS
jgi:glycosyltransferase involved in cell wall biosynthesis